MNEAERLSRRWFEEGWVKGDESVFRELTPDTVSAELATGPIDNLEAFLDFRRELLAALPDLTVTIDDLLAAEDRTAILWTFAGRHTGRGFGLEPTGREVKVQGTTWQTIRDGKIAGGIDCWDLGSMLQRLQAAADG